MNKQEWKLKLLLSVITIRCPYYPSEVFDEDCEKASQFIEESDGNPCHHHTENCQGKINECDLPEKWRLYGPF